MSTKSSVQLRIIEELEAAKIIAVAAEAKYTALQRFQVELQKLTIPSVQEQMESAANDPIKPSYEAGRCGHQIVLLAVFCGNAPEGTQKAIRELKSFVEEWVRSNIRIGEDFRILPGQQKDGSEVTFWLAWPETAKLPQAA